MSDGVGPVLAALSRVCAEVLRRQGAATTPFVRWSKGGGRSHEFAWLSGAETRETLLHQRALLRVRSGSPLFDAVQKMHATASLNPYEREVLYGYPYVIGRLEGEVIRGPLLTLPVRIETEGDGFTVRAADDVVHVNALPFRVQGEPEAHERTIGRLVAVTPELPLHSIALTGLADAVTREFSYVGRGQAKLDGHMASVLPNEPRDTGADHLEIVDQAALFIATKTSYFLASDLDNIGHDGDLTGSALEPLLGGVGDCEQVDLTDERADAAQVYFPFPSNRAQRRVALLVEDPTTRLVRVEGPPGTGKRLTISNLACHLAATGRTVLVTSQKDKALEVVDQKLRELGLAELPMTLLHHDRASKHELLRRLDQIKKERGFQEVEQAFTEVTARFGAEHTARTADAQLFGGAMSAEEAVERAHRAVESSNGLRRLVRQARFWRTRSRASRQARRTTDELAESVGARRDALLGLAVQALQIGRQRAVASATRAERMRLRELAEVIRRDQGAHRNFCFSTGSRDIRNVSPCCSSCCPYGS